MLRSTIKLVAAMSRTERTVLGVLVGVLCVSLTILMLQYYHENTVFVGVQGGTYIEGSVGDVGPLNPWFVTGNDVNRDIVSLVFSGLMKYDPVTQKIVNDLADVTISNDERTYTAVLRPNIEWHDSTSEEPHFVTADDVLFTFTTIQKQGFGNPLLQQNFQGVTMTKVDGRTIRFTLKKPYAFFTSNLTLGIVPASAFKDVPVDKLQETLDFGFHPIGAGPYAFVNLLQTDVSTEVTLKRFERPTFAAYNIERIVFRVFADYPSLLTDILNVHGVREVPRNEEGQPLLPKRFHALPYTLPQYVGAFFNMDRPIPSDQRVRLALQLGTNKKAIVDAIHETKIIDTPLLELSLGDWQYRYDATSAQGALFQSKWHQPEKRRLQRLLEERNTNSVGPLKNIQRAVFLSTGGVLTLTGSIGAIALPATVNGVRVSTGSIDGVRTGSGVWHVTLRANTGTGGLSEGMNVIKLRDRDGDIVDTAFLERFTNLEHYRRAAEEQRLVETFLLSKRAGSGAFIDASSLFLEQGYLRKKTTADEPHTRVNDAGEPLHITLLTSERPLTYPIVASLLKEQWKALGVDVTLDVEPRKVFEEKLLKREYDVVLFGESLFENLDAYPYWHSSQIQERKDQAQMKLDAFNLSQYTSFEADALLTKIRETKKQESRTTALRELEEVWKKDMPAIMLYSPLHIVAYDDSVHGYAIDHLAIHADRFANLGSWYVTKERRFVSGKSWLQFPMWLLKLGKMPLSS